MSNLENYHKYSNPPEWAKKEIQAGRLKGKTDINPQWRIQCLTEMFGMVGFGWKYTIDSQRIVEGGQGEKVAFVDLSLFVKLNGEWSEAITGTGGSSFVAMESKGHYTSDEAFKMAVTDAISVACKQIGIGSAIYSGSKYIASTPEKKEDKKDPPKKEEGKQEVEMMTEEQKQLIIKHASLVNIFDADKRKSLLEWVAKPQTKANAQLVIEKNEKLIIEAPKTTAV